MLLGRVDKDPVLLARRGDEIFAIDATCSHYGGPLAEGLMVEDTVRCPWHHACFSLRTGEAIAAPAFNPMSCWRVETRDGKAFVRDKIEPTPPLEKATSRSDASEGALRKILWVFCSTFGREIALQDRCAESSELGARQSLIGVLELILDNMRLSPRRRDQISSQGAAAVLPSLGRFETTSERGEIGVGSW